MWDKAPSTDALTAMLGGQLPGMTVSSAAAEAMQKSLENPLPPKHPLSTMRQNRVLDLYIGNLIAGTAIEPVKEWLEGLVTAVRESLPPALACSLAAMRP